MKEIARITGVGVPTAQSRISQGLKKMSRLLSREEFTDELFKSYTTGMWELEQTFKYDLRQHTMVKLMIFGLTDLLLVILLSLITKSALSISLLKIILYLLVPYNIICILLFSVLTIWRKQLHSYTLWLLSGTVTIAALLIANIFKIYDLKTVYWIISYLVTAFLLEFIVYSQVRAIRLEVI